MKNFVLLVCLLCCCPVLAHAEVPPSLNMAGLSALLAQNAGKVVLVNFFATWCPPCRVEVPELVAVSNAYQDVLVIGLSVDEDAKAVAPFLKSMGIIYPVYMAQQDLVRAFRVSSIPHNALYDRNGKLAISEPGMVDADMLAEAVKKLLEKQ